MIQYLLSETRPFDSFPIDSESEFDLLLNHDHFGSVTIDSEFKDRAILQLKQKHH